MAKAKLKPVLRDQMAFRGDSLEQILPPDHPVRDVWSLVCGFDLSAFLAHTKTVAGQAGAPAFDPRVLVTLWIQATLDGYSSARELSRLCEHHTVYRWICGDDPVNDHTLSDFRSAHGVAVDQLLTQVVAAAFEAGIASPLQVAQDGMKVRANAGASSYRRKETLQKHYEAAKAQVEALQEQSDASGPKDRSAAERRSRAARESAAKDRLDRLKRAREELVRLEEANAKRAADSRTRASASDPALLRASTTDPESRRMKLADGGVRPAFNVQFATTTQGGLIVGVRVTNAGTDYGQAGPMMDQVQERTGQRPRQLLVDGGFVSREDIAALEESEVTVYAPVKDEAKARASGRDPFLPRKGDGPEVAAWRVRMGTEEAKAIYRLRGQTAELPNARCRNCGLRQFQLRGLEKVQTEATWHAVSQNIQRVLALVREKTLMIQP